MLLVSTKDDRKILSQYLCTHSNYKSKPHARHASVWVREYPYMCIVQMKGNICTNFLISQTSIHIKCTQRWRRFETREGEKGGREVCNQIWNQIEGRGNSFFEAYAHIWGNLGVVLFYERGRIWEGGKVRLNENITKTLKTSSLIIFDQFLPWAVVFPKLRE